MPGPTPQFRQAFLGVSVALTGFSALELEGTGVVDQYASFLEQLLDAIVQTAGPGLRSRFEAIAAASDPSVELAAVFAVRAADDPPDPLDTLLQNVGVLWYLGTWQQLPGAFYAAIGATQPPIDTAVAFIPSVLAYAQGLAWRVACAHAPGVSPTGYGGWSLPPVVPVHELPPIARGVPS